MNHARLVTLSSTSTLLALGALLVACGSSSGGASPAGSSSTQGAGAGTSSSTTHGAGAGSSSATTGTRRGG